MILKTLPVLFLLVILLGCQKEDSIQSKLSDYSFEEPVSSGNTFYIDPVNGSSEGDGSASNPWKTLQEVIETGLIEHYRPSENYVADSPLEIVNEGAPVKGGDILILLSGYHGYISVNTFVFNEWLTIKSAENNTPVFSQIKFVGAFKNIYLKDLTVIKDSYLGDGNYWDTENINRNVGNCLYFASSSFWGKGSDIKINGVTVKTSENTTSWSANDWVQKAAGGIGLRSVLNTEIVNCTIENIRHGITIDYHSDFTNVVNNTIKGFSGDGSQIISNDVLFAYNTITDCYKVDDNHDDAIQSYSRGEDNSFGTGVVKNVIIRGNTIIGSTNPSHPLASYPQAIGCFDGMFDSWVIENNLIITNPYHGISFYGMLNSYILNNTVIDQVPEDNICPWIMITDHKNGTSSENCTVANNIIASSVSVKGENVEESNNYIIGKTNYAQVYKLFIDPDNFDMHILYNDDTKTNIIDQGYPVLPNISSMMDKDLKPRESVPDLGAFEY
jgi:hypothetical protein